MKIAAYNIMSGGFNSYACDYLPPDRLNLLKKAVKIIDADFIGLIDTFRWKDIYSEKDLEKLFGYRYVFHIDMNDTRVDKKIGIAVMTNLPVKIFEKVRLYNRDCIKATVVGKKNLIDIFTVYLDDVSEDVRLKETNLLLKNITTNSTVIMGDLNAIDNTDVGKLNESYREFLQKNPDFINTREYKSYFKPVFKDIIRAEVVKLIRAKGFKEARNNDINLPTFPTKLHPFKAEKPIVRVDHIFVSSEMEIKNFKVYPGNFFEKTSDHYPISANIQAV